MNSRTERIRRLKRLFQARFGVFRRAIAEPPEPLKIGIHKDILAAAPEIPKADVMCFLGWWAARIGYLRSASAVGRPRRDLDGNVCGEVGPAEAEWAAATVAARELAFAAQRATKAEAEEALRAEQQARDEKKKADLAELERRRAEKKANRERDAQERAGRRKEAAPAAEPVQPAPAPPAAPARPPIVEVRKSRAISRSAIPAAPAAGTLRLGPVGKLSLGPRKA